MSHRNVAVGSDIILDSVSEDLKVKRDLYVGNDIFNDKLLSRITKIENDILEIKNILASLSSVETLDEVKQHIADIYEIINPQ
jgi:hypothetical protein